MKGSLLEFGKSWYVIWGHKKERVGPEAMRNLILYSVNTIYDSSLGLLVLNEIIGHIMIDLGKSRFPENFYLRFLRKSRSFHLEGKVVLNQSIGTDQD